MAGRKRGTSLEERLAAIRMTPEDDPPAPLEESAPFTPPAPVAIAEPADPEPDAPHWFRAETPAGEAPLSQSAEGDTFLPGSAALTNRVDVGAAVQAAVRQLWPELENAEQPVEVDTTPEETPLLSKLLG